MRPLLVSLGIVALCLSGAAHADEESAVKAIHKLGGKVTRDDKQPGKPVTGVSLYGTKVTDADLKELKDLKQLKELDLSYTDVTDAGLKELKELKQLTSLDLTDTKVMDAGLKELKELKNLTYLSLRFTKVTDAGVKELRNLNNLTTLDLRFTKVTDPGLKESKDFKQLITALKNLTTLDLSHTKVTDADLKELKDLKQLKHLDLSGTKVGDEGLKELKDLKQLTTLNLAGTKITDAGLKELQDLKQLTVLNLSYTDVTDAGLKELKELKTLTTLDLTDTKVTDAGLKELRELKNLTSLLAEKYLHDGKFADGETASLLALDANPKDDEARFGLGVIQFVRAVENLGKALYEYGAVSEKATQPFLRLPVPKNGKPSAISYKALGRVLDAFAADLGRAEATLAGIKDDKVKLRLRLAKITFDFSGTGKDRTTLIDLLTKLNGGRFDFQKGNPDFRVHFDRGDVAWLRAYCHLLSAMVEGYRAVDEEAGFEERVKEIFPKVEASDKKADPDWINGLKIVDAPRLRRMRLHLVAVCELNRETWEHIRKETDDDYEWLPHPKQTDQLGLPLTNERIDAWLAMMAQWEGLLKGERLVSSTSQPILVLQLLYGLDHPKGKGVNIKKLLDDPPADLLNLERIGKKGIDAKYLEVEEGKKEFDIEAVNAVIQLLDGPFGFAYAARLN